MTQKVDYNNPISVKQYVEVKCDNKYTCGPKTNKDNNYSGAVLRRIEEVVQRKVLNAVPTRVEST